VEIVSLGDDLTGSGMGKEGEEEEWLTVDCRRIYRRRWLRTMPGLRSSRLVSRRRGSSLLSRRLGVVV
jgi:hypothetical protein